MSQPKNLRFDIAFDVSQACFMIERLYEDFPELQDDADLRLGTIEGETNILEILDRLIEVERTAKILRLGIHTEIDRLQERDSRMQRREHAVRQYMMKLMEAANLKKAERPAATVSIAAGRPKVIITDESAIPPAYTRTKVEIDKESIAKTLRALGEVPGAVLSNPKPQLRIS